MGASCSKHLKLAKGFWFSSVQSFSHVQLFATPWTIACQASLSITNSKSLLKLMSIESVMPSNHLILCCTLLLLPSIFHNIGVFSNESVLCMRWPKYWSFSFSIGPSNEHPGLISFRMDWLDLLAVQEILKSLLQHRSSKASILRRSAFFIEKMLSGMPPKITVQASGTGNGFRMGLSSLAYVGILFSVPCHFFFPSALLQLPFTYQTLGLQGRLRNWGQRGY